MPSHLSPKDVEKIHNIHIPPIQEWQKMDVGVGIVLLVVIVLLIVHVRRVRVPFDGLSSTEDENSWVWGIILVMFLYLWSQLLDLF